ncbi:TPA: hypothetical protein N0X70_001536 [Enterobacter roggenkampii]|uniref:hypothetical protein n=1 Tax=Enterobacter roggenkampii TaxID=1812935 RepID=UPI0003865045|nr:hypothetical protein [Enterobacter roggenkampii]EPY97118.1 hypothetical protein L799_08820 [Enterobacter roggenkampii EC_38VIM1]KTK00452.1 hypothetical protein ASU70_07580 [Enterobacter roggenkampii]MCC7579623.1 hypothetical protein [Enterobacter roggenkampii]MCC7588950.1 hypothetical protein [Enterobacter roggenkampii]MCC7593547.1 hypothetical protein [Enterobacter roggenkampii]
MKDFKGTKDKWFVDDDSWSDGDHAVITCEAREGMVPIALINGAGSESGYADEFSAEQRANSKLIAAAPDLLEALQKMFRAGQKQNWNERYESEMNVARAAIRKALGEE